MYRLTVKDSIFTIPKENIGMFAYVKAQDNGQIIDPRNIDGAIAYLESIGIKVEDEPKQEDLTKVPECPDWNNRQHRDLYNKLFYQKIDRPLTVEEKKFCSTMYHLEEYACGLDGDR